MGVFIVLPSEHKKKKEHRQGCGKGMNRKESTAERSVWRVKAGLRVRGAVRGLGRSRG